MWIDIFIVHIKADDIAEDVKSRFKPSNYELDRPLLKTQK